MNIEPPKPFEFTAAELAARHEYYDGLITKADLSTLIDQIRGKFAAASSDGDNRRE